ncbi:MAG: hypothetical protein JXR18_14085, partial [Neptuniibacter sp.]
LHLTSGNIDKAKETWVALDPLGDSDALYLFKEGMLDLVEENYSDCINKLRQGIPLNTLNQDLNHDMLNIIADAEAALEKSALTDSDSGVSASKQESKAARLSIYENEQ